MIIHELKLNTFLIKIGGRTIKLETEATDEQLRKVYRENNVKESAAGLYCALIEAGYYTEYVEK